MSGFFDFQERIARKCRTDATPATKPPPADAQPLTVSQLTAKIEKAIAGGLPQSLLVQGEVSNHKHHSASGHIYFTLKDANACIDCVMWKSDAERLKFKAVDGMELIARGHVAVYPARGRYQLYVSTLHPVGMGALELAFKQLCAKLQGEGLFAAERKRAIPRYPMRIALVTSRQTAALQDMLKVLRRFCCLRLYVYHVPVQGDGSAQCIAAALDHLGRAGDIGGIDVILLGRGGGSLEDLWAFNEEIVARAIVRCPIPVVSGIGHEVDVTIADLVADHHAHTPTEAAQTVTAHWRNARELLDNSTVRLRREVLDLLDDARLRLAAIERHEAFRRPLDRLNQSRQLLDDRQRALTFAAVTRLSRQHERVSRLASSIAAHHPRNVVALASQRLTALRGRLLRTAVIELERQRRRVDALGVHLNAVGPQQVLRRGYTITRMKKTSAVVRSAAQVRERDRLLTRFADGEVESVAQDANQPRLFE